MFLKRIESAFASISEGKLCWKRDAGIDDPNDYHIDHLRSRKGQTVDAAKKALQSAEQYN
jgi:hypothetical protein